MTGWIKIHRILLTKPIWKKSTPQQRSVLITLLLMANHEGNEWEWHGEKFEVLPGQFVTSLESIRTQAGKGISIQNVRSSLNRFEKLGFLTYKSTKSGRIINICNWYSYQDKNSKNQQRIPQRGNKEATTNNNEKNEKKKNSVFKPPCLDEFEKYFLDNGYSVELADRAFKYYSEGAWKDANGRKVKNWKQKCQGVWFKPENKIRNNHQSQSYHKEFQAI